MNGIFFKSSDHEWPFTGVKIYYGDGSVVRLPINETFAEGWETAPADNIQVINLFTDATYKQQGIKYPYLVCLSGQDVYWWSPTQGFGAADTHKMSEVPEDAEVKQGKYLAEGEFLAIYNVAHKDRFF